MSATADTEAEPVTTTHVELGTAARPDLVRWCTWRVGGGVGGALRVPAQAAHRP